MGLKLAGAMLLSLLARGALAEDPIWVASTAPFADPNSIAQNVRDECGLPKEQIDQLLYDTNEASLPIKVNDVAVAAKQGRVLLIEITRAISKGTGYLGHNKEVAIQGRLLSDGVEVASFTAMRGSGGGMWGAYMNACAVMHRCQDTLGGDVTEWLRHPTKDAKLGEYAEQ
jgi:hypothetical protein